MSFPKPINVPPLMRPGETRESWTASRRAELREILERQCYGFRPVERPPQLAFRQIPHAPDSLEQDDAPIGFAGDGANYWMLRQWYDSEARVWKTDVFEISAPRKIYSSIPEWTPDWRVTFADSTRAYKTALTGSESKKGVLRLLIRCRLAGSMKVWIAYDGGGFEEAAEFSEIAKTSKVIPLILRRCDFWQLRLTGTGDAVIYSIAVEKYGGEWQQA